jgi:hypothetical protein
LGGARTKGEGGRKKRRRRRSLGTRGLRAKRTRELRGELCPGKKGRRDLLKGKRI